MKLFNIDSSSGQFLVDQIVLGIQKLIDDYVLRRGARLPSIRRFASEHGVSRFTVVQAYDRLVASGYLLSKPAAGFYVAPRPQTFNNVEPRLSLDRAMDVLWLLRSALQQPDSASLPGSGWLPSSWLEQSGIERSLREVSRSGECLTQYGCAEGYLPLRQLLQRRLADIEIQADCSQIVLTHGVTHGLDLVARYFIRPGDTVLVDDPGYFILNGSLQSLGATVIGVSWRQQGPDPQDLESLIIEHQPKLFFTNSVLHNPTGTSINQSVAYRLLQLAEKYDIIIVEDDIYADFQATQKTRLASLDQLDRVIYLSGFSKTISASIRVGFIACKQALAVQLTDVKLLAGLTTSEANERLIHTILSKGYYRKHLDGLHRRLDQALQKTLQNFERLGLRPNFESEGGMFIWVKMPEHIDIIEMATAAARQKIMLAPGHLFRPQQQHSQYMRFNIACCNDKASLNFLQQYLNPN